MAKINETNVLKFNIFIKIKTSCLKNLTKLFLSEKADKDKNIKSANYRMEQKVSVDTISKKR